MNAREFHLSLFLEVVVLQIDPTGEIIKILLNTKSDFKTSGFKTIFSFFCEEEETRLRRLLESEMQIKKRFVKLNIKTGLEEYVDVEIAINGEEMFFFIQFFSSQRNREVMYDRHVEKLAAFSKRDPMTKVLNRQGFDELFRVLIKRSDPKKKIGFIYADLDNLKKINDASGHVAGDKAILNVTNIFTSALRERDLIARWGGDEFLFVVEEVTGNKSTTYGLAERISKLIAKRKEDTDVTTVSLGVHVFEAGKLTKYVEDYVKFAEKCNDEIHDADKTVYMAKKAGKNQIAVSEGFKKFYKLS